MIKNETCCFTGHRDIPSEQKDMLENRLDAEIKSFIEAGCRRFVAGGALGFDTMAALSVIELRKTFGNIELMLALPCSSQANSWEDKDRQLYESIIQQADDVVYVSQKYTRGCMFKRNRYMVDCSSACICYLIKPTGGTAYTVSYARKKGLLVSNIATPNSP